MADFSIKKGQSQELTAHRYVPSQELSIIVQQYPRRQPRTINKYILVTVPKHEHTWASGKNREVQSILVLRKQPTLTTTYKLYTYVLLHQENEYLIGFELSILVSSQCLCRYKIYPDKYSVRFSDPPVLLCLYSQRRLYCRRRLRLPRRLRRHWSCRRLKLGMKDFISCCPENVTHFILIL
jgi:hypothetical protein